MDNMKFINRSIIVITPKQPYIDWLNSLELSANKYTVELYKNDGGVYLVEDIENNKDFEATIMNNYEKFFERELKGVEPNEDKWPSKRNLELFHEWFDIHYHTVIADIANINLEYEEI